MTLSFQLEATTILDEPKTNRRRLSFSIANLLLLMIVIGLGLALYEAKKRVANMQPEIEMLRVLARPLTIEDPERTHLIALPTGDELTWQWRIKIPKGSSYMAGSSMGPFFDDGMPVNPQMGGASIPDEEGVVMTVKVRRQKAIPESTQSQLMVTILFQQGSDPTKMLPLGAQSHYFSLGKKEEVLFTSSFMARLPGYSQEIAGLDKQETYSLDDLIPLFRFKLSRSEEVFVWLESTARFGKKKGGQGVVAVPPVKGNKQDASPESNDASN